MNLLDNIGSAWLGTETSLKYLEEVHNKMLAPDFDKKMFQCEDEDQPGSLPGYIEEMVQEVIPGISIVTIRGPMIAGSAGWWGSFFGLVGYDDIKAAVVHAKETLKSETIFMDYGTPGGSVMGIEELSTFLADQPELISYSGSQVTSGGLWLAVTAKEFWTSKMAEVGSVGVISVTSELTEAFKMEGRNVSVFKSSPLKAVGNPYEKLTEDQAKEIQGSVDRTHQFFIDHLSTNLSLPKPFVASELATGQVWFGQEANDKGLTSGIRTLENLVSLAMNAQIEDNSQEQQNSINFQRLTSMSKENIVEDEANSEETPDNVEALALAAAGAKLDIEQHSPEEDECGCKGEADCECDDTQVAEVVEEKDDSVSDKIMNQLVDLKVELKEAQNKITKMDVDHSGMKEVLVSVIQNTSVALGSPAPSKDVLGTTDVSVLLQQYSQLAAQLNERFGAGGRISAQAEDSDGDVETAVQHVENVYLKLAKI